LKKQIIETSGLNDDLLAAQEKPKSSPGASVGILRKRKVKVTMFKQGSQGTPEYKYVWFEQGPFGVSSKHASDDADVAFARIGSFCNFPVTKGIIFAVRGGHLNAISLLKCGTMSASAMSQRRPTGFVIDGSGKLVPELSDYDPAPLQSLVQLQQCANNFGKLVSALLGPTDIAAAFWTFATVTFSDIMLVPNVSPAAVLSWFQKKLDIYAADFTKLNNIMHRFAFVQREEHLLYTFVAPPSAGSRALATSATPPVTSAPKKAKAAAQQATSVSSKAAKAVAVATATNVNGILGAGFTLHDLKLKSACLSWNNFAGVCPRNKCTFKHMCGICGNTAHQMGVPGCP
jgi:hypothetical protein